MGDVTAIIQLKHKLYINLCMYSIFIYNVWKGVDSWLFSMCD